MPNWWDPDWKTMRWEDWVDAIESYASPHEDTAPLEDTHPVLGRIVVGTRSMIFGEGRFWRRFKKWYRQYATAEERRKAQILLGQLRERYGQRGPRN